MPPRVVAAIVLLLVLATAWGLTDRAADRVRATQFKVSAYAEYLLDEKDKLDRALAAARAELRAKVEQLAEAPLAVA